MVVQSYVTNKGWRGDLNSGTLFPESITHNLYKVKIVTSVQLYPGIRKNTG